MSWINIKIQNDSFIYKCISSESHFSFYLSDFKQLWVESCSSFDILRRGKEQNKRIEYDNDIILKTIKEIPYNIDIVKSPISDEKTLVLLVKYYLSNRPFTFQWKLNLCSQDEFFDMLTKPLLLSVKCFAEKTGVLKDVIKKKDMEIQQYKIEGAILKRSKVATNEFHENEFESEYPKTIAGELLEYVDEKYSNWKVICDKNFKQPTSGTSSTIGQSNKFNESSPNKNAQKGNKAKNLILLRKQQLAKKYQNREKNVNYMDSDISLTPTPPEKPKEPKQKEPEQNDDADDDDLLSIAKSLQELEKQRKADLELATPSSKPKRKKFSLF